MLSEVILNMSDVILLIIDHTPMLLLLLSNCLAMIPFITFRLFSVLVCKTSQISDKFSTSESSRDKYNSLINSLHCDGAKIENVSYL